MKGLMVTLLVVLGSGSSLAQQFGGNDFSANRTNRTATQNSSLRTNQTRLQPLTRNFDRTSMRVAQSSSTNDSSFSVTSRQTIGGTNYKDGSSKEVPVPASDSEHNNGLYVDGKPPSGMMGRQNNSQSNMTRGSVVSSQSSNSQLRAWPLPVSQEWERTLKSEGYIYAPIQPHERNSIGEVVMFQDGSQFGNRSQSGSSVTPKQWEIYKNTAIIDVDDLSLQEIQKRTLTLRNLGPKNLTGVALRYVHENGNKIDVRRIGNIPGNSSSVQAAPREDFSRNQPATNRGSRPNERQVNSRDQREVSFTSRDRRPNANRQDFDSFARNTDNDSGWNLNDEQRVRQPNESYQRDTRDRFAADNRDFSRTNDRRLSNEYFDSLPRRNSGQRDQRDIDYVRDQINQDRNDDYLIRDNSRYDRNTIDSRINDDQYPRSSRTVSGDLRDGRHSLYDGRSQDFDSTFASQRRELQQRLLDAKRLEVKNAEEAAWLQRQRESMEEARLASLYDDDMPSLRRRSSTSQLSEPYRFGSPRLADRSTDPIYHGQRVDALAPARASNASADRVAQILAEKEADLDAKMGAIDHLMKLDSASRELDSKINTLKNNSQTPNNSHGRVQSLVRQTVPNTLGGDLAAPRHTRLASSNTGGTTYDGLNGGAPPLDINGYPGQRARGSSAFRDQNSGGSSDGRMLRLMWLLLLISLGANVYLAMLSRSFYTQYEELADELRETFSTSSPMRETHSRTRPMRETHSSTRPIKA